MRNKMILLYGAVASALTCGAYCLLTTLADAWSVIPPSQHVVAMAFAVIVSFALGIAIEFGESGKRER